MAKNNIQRSARLGAPETGAPCSERISDEARQAWLEFVDFVNEGYAAPYHRRAVGDQIFAIGCRSITQCSAKDRAQWREWVRRQLLTTPTVTRRLDRLTDREKELMDRYLERVGLSEEGQAALEAYEALSEEEQAERRRIAAAEPPKDVKEPQKAGKPRSRPMPGTSGKGASNLKS